MEEEFLSKEDREALLKAQELIQSTDLWKNFASDDYDYTLHMANHNLEQTLNKQWWT